MGIWIRQDRAWYRFITPFFINHDYLCHTTPRQNVNETMTRQRGDMATRRHDDTRRHVADFVFWRGRGPRGPVPPRVFKVHPERRTDH